MKKTLWKRSVWALVVLGVGALLVHAFRPTPIPVDVVPVSRGTLRITVDDDGYTRVRERYTISAPIRGLLLRTILNPGDPVLAGETLVAEFVPIAPELLDARMRGEAEARLNRAEAAYRQAGARKEQAEVDLRFAESELERIRQLHDDGVESEGRLDRAVRDERRALQGMRATEFGVQVAHYELELARASLVEDATANVEVEPDPDQESSAVTDSFIGRGDVYRDRKLPLLSPINGVILRVLEESARPLTAGTAILEVGNTDALEVVADYLSQDAVKVEPGMGVIVEGWGGEDSTGRERPLDGRVRVVEPGGYTKTSALGVEERRVNVIVDPSGDPREWAALGDGFHVELRIVLWEQDDVVIVPTGTLFREGDAWAAFVVEDGVARQRVLELGRRSALEAQVLGGLEVGDQVVLYPSGMLGDGTPVEPRR